MGGLIVVDSRENEGSSFSFSLPLASHTQEDELEHFTSEHVPQMDFFALPSALQASVSKEEIRRNRPPEIEEEEKISFAEKFILAVDDHPMNLDVLEMMLVKKLDRSVTCCNSGEEGIREVRRIAEKSRGKDTKILILMDINMPTMDGIETTKHIKAFLRQKDNI